MKQIFVLGIIGLISLIVVLSFFKPFEPEIEEMYKNSFYTSFFSIFIALLVRYKLKMFSGSFWRLFFALFFIIGISSGVGIVIKTALLDRISYLGLALIIFSLFFYSFNASQKQRLITFKIALYKPPSPLRCQ
jgi:hypothetical protein